MLPLQCTRLLRSHDISASSRPCCTAAMANVDSFSQSFYRSSSSRFCVAVAAPAMAILSSPRLSPTAAHCFACLAQSISPSLFLTERYLLSLPTASPHMAHFFSLCSRSGAAWLGGNLCLLEVSFACKACCSADTHIYER